MFVSEVTHNEFRSSINCGDSCVFFIIPGVNLHFCGHFVCMVRKLFTLIALFFYNRYRFRQH